jgi:spore coat polysaccharide biosynthesis predicted glycosyltransferase SpsG
MKVMHNKILIDYFLTPSEMELLKKEESGSKEIIFNEPSNKNIHDIFGLLEKYATLKSRYGAENSRGLYSNRVDIINGFDYVRMRDAIPKINVEMIQKYNSNSKTSKITKFEQLSDIEKIILRKALNRKGWLVDIAPKSEKTFILAPRYQEYKTHQNKNIKNYDPIRQADGKIPFSKFYRGK